MKKWLLILSVCTMIFSIGKIKQTNDSISILKPVQDQEVSKKQSINTDFSKKFPQFFFVKGSSSLKKIALTFDDGPDQQFTPPILHILKKYKVKATFFVVGYRANKHPDLIRQMVKDGHVIGNHSYNHANFVKLDSISFRKQIEKTQAVLYHITGYYPSLLRPPYGAITEEQIKWAVSHHYKIIHWNVDSLDWKELEGKQVIENIMTHTKPGSIILQHAGGGLGEDLSGTVKALPIIIQKLRKQGYHFVTIPELLHIQKNKEKASTRQG